ncbi:MAG: histidine kinase dimerization/phospho-acceptor domain-containing protein [Candidatus Acidiferrales bacterium]
MKRTNLSIANLGHHVVLGLRDQAVAAAITAAAQNEAQRVRFTICGNMTDLRDCLRRDAAAVMLLDESILGAPSLGETLLQLTESSPVIVLAAPWRQVELGRWIAGGDVEFVPNVGEFVSLAAAFIARRLRWAELAESPVNLPWGELPPDFASILRHEINNPLTGILGNAELLLAHSRGKLATNQLQRLETVLDLAVRLRETTRRLSNAWEREHTEARTA